MDALDLIEVFKDFVRSSFIDAQMAHDCIFDEKCSTEIALAYLNKAIAAHYRCDSLYYAKFDQLERGEYENYSQRFEIFASELLTNVRTNHSHQWTDIEFQKLKDVFDYSAFSFDN